MGAISSSLDERVALLTKLDSVYCAGLQEDELRRMAEPAKLIEAPKGEFLYHQGELALHVYLLVSGLVKILCTHPSGRRAIIKFIKPGLAFRIAHPTATARYLASAQAATDVRALRWDIHDALSLLETSPQLARNSVAVLTQMLADFAVSLSEFACGCAEERLRGVLQRLGEDLREDDHAVLPITQQELADSTGLSLYTVNRILKSLEQLGIVERHRHLLIVWPAKLRAYTRIQTRP